MTVLEERGKRYGEFKTFAETAQNLKYEFRRGRQLAGKSASMTYCQQEAIDMILHKIARIANGDENYDDNWIDIAGYATLASNEINDIQRSK